MQVQKWVVGLVAAVALVVATGDADAKRLGGSRSVGKQNSQVNKDSMQQPASPSPAASPAAAAGAPTAAAAAKAPAAAAAAPARNRWLAPLAGLAAGLGLAALASHLGFGEGFANIMMLVLFGMIALFAIRWFMAKRAAGNMASSPALAGASAGAYGAPQTNSAAFQAESAAASSAGLASPVSGAGVAQATWSVPAGFDVDSFLRNARVHYIRMQSANDSSNLDDLREFTSNELYAELAEDVRARQGKAQTTEVVSLNSQLVHFEQVGGFDQASVRFTGVVREDSTGPADSFDEVWNLQRPSDASKGWIVAGIQQVE
jgi:predicted lipid-binding transport protein (Tim44 family)